MESGFKPLAQSLRQCFPDLVRPRSDIGKALVPGEAKVADDIFHPGKVFANSLSGE